jgi:hypothetical protein
MSASSRHPICSDTGDLWLYTPQVARLYGVSERTAQWWASRYDCAIDVPRDDVGGTQKAFWRPALDYARAEDTGPAADERRDMRIFSQRFFEP